MSEAGDDTSIVDVIESCGASRDLAFQILSALSANSILRDGVIEKSDSQDSPHNTNNNDKTATKRTHAGKAVRGTNSKNAAAISMGSIQFLTTFIELMNAVVRLDGGRLSLPIRQCIAANLDFNSRVLFEHKLDEQNISKSGHTEVDIEEDATAEEIAYTAFKELCGAISTLPLVTLCFSLEPLKYFLATYDQCITPADLSDDMRKPATTVAAKKRDVSYSIFNEYAKSPENFVNALAQATPTEKCCLQELFRRSLKLPRHIYRTATSFDLKALAHDKVRAMAYEDASNDLSLVKLRIGDNFKNQYIIITRDCTMISDSNYQFTIPTAMNILRDYNHSHFADHFVDVDDYMILDILCNTKIPKIIDIAAAKGQSFENICMNEDYVGRIEALRQLLSLDHLRWVYNADEEADDVPFEAHLYKPCSASIGTPYGASPRKRLCCAIVGRSERLYAIAVRPANADDDDRKLVIKRGQLAMPSHMHPTLNSISTQPPAASSESMTICDPSGNTTYTIVCEEKTPLCPLEYFVPVEMSDFKNGIFTNWSVADALSDTDDWTNFSRVVSSSARDDVVPIDVSQIETLVTALREISSGNSSMKALQSIRKNKSMETLLNVLMKKK